MNDAHRGPYNFESFDRLRRPLGSEEELAWWRCFNDYSRRYVKLSPIPVWYSSVNGVPCGYSLYCFSRDHHTACLGIFPVEEESLKPLGLNGYII